MARVVEMIHAVNGIGGKSIDPAGVVAALEGTTVQGNDVQAFLMAGAEQEQRRRAIKQLADQPTPQLVAAATGDTSTSDLNQISTVDRTG